jgi:hypothetical protein
MVPEFMPNGNLPPGIHRATWEELCERFGHTPRRRSLLQGLSAALKQLSRAGCTLVYIDGSFVTAKEIPGDYDLCWSIERVSPEKLDPSLLDFSPEGRVVMKGKYLGDLFPAEIPEGASGKAFLDFFQIDKETGDPKGIVALDIGGFDD